MMSYLHTKFHDNWISSFRGVAMTRFWDGRTDRQTDGQTNGVTALLDLLSPSATQVKIFFSRTTEPISTNLWWGWFKFLQMKKKLFELFSQVSDVAHGPLVAVNNLIGWKSISNPQPSSTGIQESVGYMYMKCSLCIHVYEMKSLRVCGPFLSFKKVTEIFLVLKIMFLRIK